jgi:hypothetical protein
VEEAVVELLLNEEQRERERKAKMKQVLMKRKTFGTLIRVIMMNLKRKITIQRIQTAMIRVQRKREQPNSQPKRGKISKLNFCEHDKVSLSE